ncbi:MAG: TIGR03790 family protein [Desulfofustis sp.]|nr:TIGR03790 family protein [Desulfofustis sp.]
MNSLLLRYLLLLSAVLSIFYGPSSVSALLPDEIVVVANSRAADSVKLAKYYMKMRGIPSEHLIKIRTTWEESCARKDYDDNIATPILKAINNLRTSTNIRSIVTMFGVPLKIRPPTLDFDDEEQVNTLRHQLQQLQTQSQTADIQEQPGLKEQVKSLITQIELLLQTNKRASIDSELALVLVEDYPLENWLPNPFFLGFQNKELFLKKDKVLIVSRLDGPTADTVRRVIDDTVAVEKIGLQGTACFDARWQKSETDKKKSGYTLYDAALHHAAAQLTENGPLPVVIDDRPELFTEGACPDAALYSGWYSLANYADVFNWVPGSIGFHIASSECATLKQEKSQVWCKRMLEEGVAATIGPVYEPYVQAFPPPDLFFAKLTEGYLTLGEVYLISLPFLSWQMVLIGDPLYLPFKPAAENP